MWTPLGCVRTRDILFPTRCRFSLLAFVQTRYLVFIMQCRRHEVSSLFFAHVYRNCDIGIKLLGKGKVLPYSLRSVGHGADPGVQAVSPQVTLSHPPCSRLPLLSANPVVTFPAKEHHRPSASTKLYCLVTEAHGGNNLPKVVTPHSAAGGA